MDILAIREQMNKMRDTGLEDIAEDELVDIQNIKIDASLSKQERIFQYLDRIKNPYCFKCDTMIVRVKFNDDGITLQDKLINYFKSVE